MSYLNKPGKAVNDPFYISKEFLLNSKQSVKIIFFTVTMQENKGMRRKPVAFPPLCFQFPSVIHIQ